MESTSYESVELFDDSADETEQNDRTQRSEFVIPQEHAVQLERRRYGIENCLSF